MDPRPAPRPAPAPRPRPTERPARLPVIFAAVLALSGAAVVGYVALKPHAGAPVPQVQEDRRDMIVIEHLWGVSERDPAGPDVVVDGKPLGVVRFQPSSVYDPRACFGGKCQVSRVVIAGSRRPHVIEERVDYALNGVPHPVWARGSYNEAGRCVVWDGPAGYMSGCLPVRVVPAPEAP